MAPEPKKSRKRAAKPAATKVETSPAEVDQKAKPAAKRATKKVVAQVPTELSVPVVPIKAKKPVPVPLFQEAPISVAPKSVAVAPKKSRIAKTVAPQVAAEVPEASESEEQAQRRRRRRGGRGRRRPTGDESIESTVNADGETLDPDSLDGEEEEDVLSADGTTH